MGLFDIFRKEEKAPDWLEMLPKEMASIFLNEIKSNPQACRTDEIPEGTGRFGYDVTNPIPVFGVPENEVYLNRLHLPNGNRVRYRRIKSMLISEIEKSIDQYELFDLKGNTIAVLYISPYHLRTSKKAPLGFKLQ